MAPRSAIFFSAICSRSMVEAPGTTWGAMALWTWRRAMPEIRIFSISCGDLIMMAIRTVSRSSGCSAFRCSEALESGFDCAGDLFDGLVSVYFFESALLAVVLDDGSG